MVWKKTGVPGGAREVRSTTKPSRPPGPPTAPARTKIENTMPRTPKLRYGLRGGGRGPAVSACSRREEVRCGSHPPQPRRRANVFGKRLDHGILLCCERRQRQRGRPGRGVSRLGRPGSDQHSAGAQRRTLIVEDSICVKGLLSQPSPTPSARIAGFGVGHAVSGRVRVSWHLSAALGSKSA